LILGRLTFETGDYKLSFNLLQAVALNQATNPAVLFDFGRPLCHGASPGSPKCHAKGLQTGGAFSQAVESDDF